MTIYEVEVEIRDGEHEYTSNTYVLADSWEQAKADVILFWGFNKDDEYEPYDFDSNGIAIAWEEKEGYRIYGISNVQEARINVLGLAQSIALNEVIKRPALPFSSALASHTWSRGAAFEYWWPSLNSYVFANVTPGDREHIYVGNFPKHSTIDQIEHMQLCGWKLERGPSNND